MENKYYLAVEIKPHNYFPINLLDLSISDISTTKLDELDHFTLKFTKKEILDSIKEANLLDVTLDMPLIVIYYEKEDIRKIPVLTSDIKFDMWTYLKENYQNKRLLNKIDNFLKNKIDDATFKEIKSSNTLEEYLLSLSKLPYNIERKLYFYLYEN